MKKFELTNIVWYAKGHYKRSENHFEDLKKCLEADGYTPMNNDDVMMLLVARLEDVMPEKVTGFQLLHGMKEYDWRFKISEVKDYTYKDLVVQYCMGKIMFLHKDKWYSDKEPDFENVLPMSENRKKCDLENC